MRKSAVKLVSNFKSMQVSNIVKKGLNASEKYTFIDPVVCNKFVAQKTILRIWYVLIVYLFIIIENIISMFTIN